MHNIDNLSTLDRTLDGEKENRNRAGGKLTQFEGKNRLVSLSQWRCMTVEDESVTIGPDQMIIIVK